jgi:hypothetical protein
VQELEAPLECRPVTPPTDLRRDQGEDDVAGVSSSSWQRRALDLLNRRSQTDWATIELTARTTR